MTVQYPDFPDSCPSCDCTTYRGVEKVGSVVRMDDNGSVKNTKADDPLNAWSTLWCVHCGKMFIEDGSWAIDPDGETPPHERINDCNHHSLSDYEDDG